MATNDDFVPLSPEPDEFELHSDSSSTSSRSNNRRSKSRTRRSYRSRPSRASPQSRTSSQSSSRAGSVQAKGKSPHNNSSQSSETESDTGSNFSSDTQVSFSDRSGSEWSDSDIIETSQPPAFKVPASKHQLRARPVKASAQASTKSSTKASTKSSAEESVKASVKSLIKSSAKVGGQNKKQQGRRRALKKDLKHSGPRLLPVTPSPKGKSQGMAPDIHNLVTPDALVAATEVESENPTHLQFFNPRKTFAVDYNKYSIFWPGYCRMVQEEYPDLTLGELVDQTNMPLVNDVRIIFQGEYNDLTQDESIILALVNLYQQAICQFIDPGCLDDGSSDVMLDDKELVAVVSTSQPFRNSLGQKAQYFRVYFPYCRVSRRFIESSIISHVRANFEMVTDKIYASGLVDKVVHAIEIPIFHGYLPLYCSRPHQNYPHLKYHRVYGEISTEQVEDYDEDVDPESLEFDLEQLLPVDRHSHVMTGMVNPHDNPSYENSDAPDLTSYFYPWLLSVHYYTTPSQVRTAVVTSNRSDSSQSPQEIHEDYEAHDEEEEIDDKDPEHLARQLLPLISNQRYNEDHYWLSIGQALYNITNGQDRGLEWWIRQTKISRTYDEDDCYLRWAEWNTSVEPLSSTVKTLAFFAREDAQDKYREWHHNWCQTAMMEATARGHSTVAEALYRLYWLDFTNSNTNMNSWYEYSNHHWVPMPNGCRLDDKISEDMIKKYRKMRTELSRKIDQARDENQRDGLEVKMRKIDRLVEWLDKHSNIMAIMQRACRKFYDPRFDLLRDSNFALMGAANGVIETTDSRAAFRPGKPEDYLTHCTPVMYRSTYSWKTPAVQEVIEWTHQTFCNPKDFRDKELSDSFLKLLASRLRSGNPDKIFPILSGESGDNSKSMWKKLIDLTFGPSYSITTTESILTDKERRGGPSPEIARVNGAKFVWVVEPNEDDPMRNGNIKKLSGGDAIYARNCNENGGDIKASFVLFLMCNKIPPVPRSERAVYSRLTVYPFLSRWTYDAPDSKVEQYRQQLFPRDDHFDLKIPKLAMALLWILVQKYTDYKREGLPIPRAVIEYTDRYWQETDVYNLFQESRIEEVFIKDSESEENPDGIRDQTVGLTKGEVYRMFSSWYRDSMPDSKPPSLSNFIRELSQPQRWGQPVDGRWPGRQARLDQNSDFVMM